MSRDSDAAVTSTHCNTLIATRCNVVTAALCSPESLPIGREIRMQRVEVGCSVLQYFAEFDYALQRCVEIRMQCAVVCCSAVQRDAVCRIVM